MIQFYAALGSFHRTLDEHGLPQASVISNGEEYHLNMEELVIWSGGFWTVRSKDELRSYYSKEMDLACACAEYGFDATIERLEQRGLMVRGQDILPADAIYALLSNLYIVPVSISLWAKLKAFFTMLAQGHRFAVAKRIFHKPSLTSEERQILALAQRQLMTTAELVRCVAIGADLSSEDAMVNSLYDEEHITYKNIARISKFAPEQRPVLQAVASLFLKKQVVLEKNIP